MADLYFGSCAGIFKVSEELLEEFIAFSDSSFFSLFWIKKENLKVSPLLTFFHWCLHSTMFVNQIRQYLRSTYNSVLVMLLRAKQDHVDPIICWSCRWNYGFTKASYIHSETSLVKENLGFFYLKGLSKLYVLVIQNVSV